MITQSSQLANVASGFYPWMRRANWSKVLIRNEAVDAGVVAWLHWRSSTMATLKAMGKIPKITVLFEGRARMLAPDEIQLDSQPLKMAYIREVFIEVDGQPWMYGRSCTPLNAQLILHRLLTSLGAAPLGELVFSDPSTRRSAFKFLQINDGHATYQRIGAAGIKMPKTLLSRASTILWRDQSIVLMEVFFDHPITELGPQAHVKPCALLRE